MYKSIILILGSVILSSCFLINSNTKADEIINSIELRDSLYVYQNDKRVSTLLHNTYGVECGGCYIFDTTFIFDKKITFIVPVEYTDGRKKRFDKTLNILKKKETGQEAILEFAPRTMQTAYAHLYFTLIDQKIVLEKYIRYSSEYFEKEIGEDDYESVQGLKICSAIVHDIFPDTIDGFSHQIFRGFDFSDPDIRNYENEKCFYCEYESDNYNSCINKLEHYEFKY